MRAVASDRGGAGDSGQGSRQGTEEGANVAQSFCLFLGVYLFFLLGNFCFVVLAGKDDVGESVAVGRVAI